MIPLIPKSELKISGSSFIYPFISKIEIAFPLLSGYFAKCWECNVNEIDMNPSFKVAYSLSN